MEQRDFDNWLSGNNSNQTPVEAGKDLFEVKLGCASCHQQTDQGRGPKLAGVFGSDQKLNNGQMVKADEEYIRNSILNPQGQIVEGYQPIMPTFKGQVTEEQLVSLVAYIKSMGGAGGTTTTSGSSSGASMSNTSTSGNSSRPPTSQITNTANTVVSNPNATLNQPEPTNKRTDKAGK